MPKLFASRLLASALNRNFSRPKGILTMTGQLNFGMGSSAIVFAAPVFVSTQDLLSYLNACTASLCICTKDRTHPIHSESTVFTGSPVIYHRQVHHAFNQVRYSSNRF